ncbi:MAG: hypothetical protein JWR08_358 [Enterovirga sp.]|jgi:putative spermidine/putrescine transport system permease protein|nr:hypothetical protein [Enterovirga sp.]
MTGRIRWSSVVAAATILFLLGPFVVILGASFDTGDNYHVQFPPRGFTLAWFGQISPKYVQAAWTSLVVGLAVAVLAGVIGTAAALGIVRSRIGGKEAFQAFFRLPVQIPLVVTGAVFLQFYYYVSALTGLDLLRGLAGLILAHLFIALPYCVGSVSSVLVRMNPSLEEAAQSLGATHWSTFRRVTLPAIRPGVAAGMFYAFIVSFGDVPVAIFLAAGDAATLPVRIFQDMQFDFQPSMLAVSSLIVIVSAALILAVQRFAGLDMVLPGGRR